MKRGIKAIIGVDNRFNDIKMRVGFSTANYVSINSGFVWVNGKQLAVLSGQFAGEATKSV